MIGPDKPELRGKQSPAENSDPNFQAGFQAGRVAEVPSDIVVSLLREETRRRYPDTFASITFRDKFAFSDKISKEHFEDERQARARLTGYIAGLGVFMAEHGFPTDESPIAIIQPQMLLNPRALSRYAEGLGRGMSKLQLKGRVIKKDLSSDRDTLREGLFGERISFKVQKDGDIDQGFEPAYVFGFAVSVARDYGITPGWGEVPADSLSHVAFEQGKDGKTRFMPVSLRSREKISLFEFEEQRREQAYVLGLKIWLKEQGIEGVEVAQIRNPQALQAFRAGLDGKTLSDADVKAILGISEAPAAHVDPYWSTQNFAHREIYEKKIEKDTIYPNRVLWDYEGRTVAEQLRDQKATEAVMALLSQAQANNAFGLGKQAREQRLAREQAASEQQAPAQ